MSLSIESPERIIGPPGQTPSLKKNYALNSFLSLVNILYPLLTLTYASRVIGPIGMGRFYFATSLTAYFLMLAGLGIPVYGAREIAKVRHSQDALNRTFSELFLLNAISSLVSGFCFLIVAFSVPRFHQDARLFAALSSLIFLNLFTVDFIFMGMENYKNIAWRSFISKVSSLPILFIWVKSPADLLTYAGWTIASVSLYNLLAIWSCRKIVRPSFSGLNLRRHARPLFILTATVAMVSIYTNLDSVLLGFMVGPEKVGLYNTALKISRILVVAVSSTGMVFMPRITHYVNNDMHEEFEALASKSLSFICMLSLPTAMFMISSAPEIISLVFGNKFLDASLAMRITAPLVIIIGFTNVIGMQILFSKGQEKIILFSVGVAALVSVALNLILIPRFGQNGSAAAILCAETSVLIIQWKIFRSKYPSTKLRIGQVRRYLFLSPIVALPLPILKLIGLPGSTPLFIAVILGIGIYFGSLLAIKDALCLELLTSGRLTLKRVLLPGT